MEFEQVEARWRAMSEEVISGLTEWRAAHPQATLKEIETTLDERLARLRAHMLQDTALLSQAREWRGPASGVRCPTCGTGLTPRGQQSRTLQTNGGQAVVLQREYGQCPSCGTGLFPPG